MPSLLRQLLAFCESERAAAIDALEALVRLESPSTDKEAVDRCGEEAARRLAALGARVRRVAMPSAGDCLVAEVGAGGHPVLLLGHLDTVWPLRQLELMPLRQDGDRLYGPGTFDMKGGIVIALLALHAVTKLAADRLPRTTLLLTGDEEVGSGASRPLIEAQAREHAAVLVLEPSLPGGALKTSRKGCGEFELTVRGVSAHAGIEPEKGASAVLELAEQLLAVDALQDREKGTTLNVGIVSGGTRGNVVADRAHAVIDARAVTAEEARRVDAALRSLLPRRPRTSLAITGGFDRPPLERSEAVAGLFAAARALAEQLGGRLAEGATGGGSDGNFTAALGVPTLDGLGAEGGGAHAADEHVLVDRLPFRAALLAGLVLQVGGRAGEVR